MHEHLRLAGKLDEATSSWHPEEPFSPNKGVTSTEPSIPVLGEPLWAIGVILELSSPLSLDLVDMGMANPYKTRKNQAELELENLHPTPIRTTSVVMVTTKKFLNFSSADAVLGAPLLSAFPSL